MSAGVGTARWSPYASGHPLRSWISGTVQWRKDTEALIDIDKGTADPYQFMHSDLLFMDDHRNPPNARDGSIRADHRLRFVHVDVLEPRFIAAEASMVFGTVILFAIVGPLDTDDHLGLLPRLAHWGLCAVLCWPLCHAQNALTLYFARSCAPYQIVALTTLGGLFMAMPCSAVVYTVWGLFTPPPNSPAFELWEVYLVSATVLVALISLVHYVACQRAPLRLAVGPAAAAGDGALPVPGAGNAATVARRPDDTAASSPGAADAISPATRHTVQADERQADERQADERQADESGTVGRPAADTPPLSVEAAEPINRLLDRLPKKLSRDIIYVKADAHYVDVVATDGSALILMRFADVVTQLRDRGMQVHRSYWVAHRHVLRAVRRDERTLLLLTDGHVVPVSRAHRPALRRYLDQT